MVHLITNGTSGLKAKPTIGLQFLFRRKPKSSRLYSLVFLLLSQLQLFSPMCPDFRALPWVFRTTQQNAQISCWGFLGEHVCQYNCSEPIPGSPREQEQDASRLWGFFLPNEDSPRSRGCTERAWRQSRVVGKAAQHGGDPVRLSTPSLGAALGLTMRTSVTAVAL